MNTYEYEDGSAIIVVEGCVQSVRDAETQQWTLGEPGRTYYAPDSTAITGCPFDELPDTAMQPREMDMTGAILVIILIITLLVQEMVPNKRR